MHMTIAVLAKSFQQDQHQNHNPIYWILLYRIFLVIDEVGSSSSEHRFFGHYKNKRLNITFTHDVVTVKFNHQQKTFTGPRQLCVSHRPQLSNSLPYNNTKNAFLTRAQLLK